jgi:prepilin-type N-terminal cleavage/methylation domain-containing protein
MPSLLTTGRMKTSHKAFTLIEMLLVASLLSVTGLAVYHAISDGLRVWEYSRRYSSEEDVAVFFEKLSADLQNTYRYSAIAFDGKENKILIPTIVRTPVDKEISASGDLVEQMGCAEYFLQTGEKAIYRRQANYSQSLKKKFAPARALAAPVEKLHFKYYGFEDGKLKPKKSVNKEIPVAVMVQIDFREVGGSVRHLQRMINIPIGNLP